MSAGEGFGRLFDSFGHLPPSIPANVAGETARRDHDPGIFLKPPEDGSDALAFRQCGFDLGPQRPELTGFGVRLSRASSREAGAGFRDPVVGQFHLLNTKGMAKRFRDAATEVFFQSATIGEGSRQVATVYGNPEDEQQFAAA